MPDELQQPVRTPAEPTLMRGERSQRLADLIRIATGRPWVGIYEVTPTEVVNLAWSGWVLPPSDRR